MILTKQTSSFDFKTLILYKYILLYAYFYTPIIQLVSNKSLDEFQNHGELRDFKFILTSGRSRMSKSGFDFTIKVNIYIKKIDF